MRWTLRPLAVWAIAAAIAVLLGFALAELTTTDDRLPATPAAGLP